MYACVWWSPQVGMCVFVYTWMYMCVHACVCRVGPAGRQVCLSAGVSMCPHHFQRQRSCRTRISLFCHSPGLRGSKGKLRAFPRDDEEGRQQIRQLWAWARCPGRALAAELAPSGLGPAPPQEGQDACVWKVRSARPEGWEQSAYMCLPGGIC